MGPVSVEEIGHFGMQFGGKLMRALLREHR